MVDLLEFKRTSDVRPGYLEKTEDKASKQYGNFIDILRKTNISGWTSEQLNFIVGSKSIDENAMDKNLDKIGRINQRTKKELKIRQSRQTSADTASSTS
jgi:hypothetical protein